MMSLGNSGNSSRNSTPRWALLTSPGRTRPVPPPSRLARVAEWCGALNGGRTIIRAPGAIPGRVTQVWVPKAGHDLKGKDTVIVDAVLQWLRAEGLV